MMVHTPSFLASPRCLSACLPVCLSVMVGIGPAPVTESLRHQMHYICSLSCWHKTNHCHVGTRPILISCQAYRHLGSGHAATLAPDQRVCLSGSLSLCLSVYLSVCISVSLSVSLSSCFAVRITARNHCAETRVCGNRGTSQMSSSTATCLVLSVCVSTVSVPGEGSVWLCLSTLASCAQPASWCPAPVSGLRGHRM